MTKEAKDIIERVIRGWLAPGPRLYAEFVAQEVIKDLASNGFVIVPRQATPAMDVAGRIRCHGVDVGDGSQRRACGGFIGETAAEQWERMVEAALREDG